MSAHVLLSDTFDQWRMKTNEWLSMTNSAGSSNFIKINDTTNSTSNTTGSITTLGGMGIGASAVVGGNLTVFGDADVDGTMNFDVTDIDGAWQLDATLTVGEDDTGYDVKFFGASAGALMMWDQSEDALLVRGATADHATSSAGRLVLQTNQAAITAGDILGRLDFQASNETGADALLVSASLYAEADATFSTHVNSTELVFATAEGDAVVERMRIVNSGELGIGVEEPASKLDVRGTVQVGVDGTSHDVKFFGATSGAYMLWDASSNDLEFAGAAALSIDCTTDSSSTTTGSFHTDGGMGIAKKLYVGTDLDVDGTTNLDAVDIDGAVQIDGALTVGVDDTGHDVKFFGASAGAKFLYDQSADTLEIRGANADATTSTGKLLLSTALTDINDGDVIGRIDWKTPLEASGTDAEEIGASIWAEADATFSSSVNSTDLVFATGDSGAATEKMRIDSTGQVTFADGAIDVDIASQDRTNGLKLGGTLVKASATDFNGLIPLGKSLALALVFAKTD